MKPLILIPTYNPGRVLRETVEGCLEAGGEQADVWVVIDGSTDESEKELESLSSDPRLRVLQYSPTRGKGHAILTGAEEAAEAGYTHILTIDSDGQHPVDYIPRYLEAAQAYPEAALYGEPVFDENAPSIRVQGRKISNRLVHFETMGWGVRDVLFGMRLYPTKALLRAMQSTRFGRRYDFDTEVAVLLSWAEVPAINVPTPVRYLSEEEGGISHFHYFRDNFLLGTMHLRIALRFLFWFPKFLATRPDNPHYFTKPITEEAN